MNVEFDYKKQTFEIQELIGHMPEVLEKEEKAVLRKIGKAVEKEVVKMLRLFRTPPEKANKRKNYDKTVPYVQMDDDVTFSVRKSKSGDIYVSIKGKKYTGYKWHFLNDGTRNPDGTVHTAATHFMDISLTRARGEIEKCVNELVGKVAEDGK